MAGNAQNAEAFSSIDRDSIMIGDQFQYKMGINVPEGFIVAWPQLMDTISKNIEIIDIQDIDTSYQENTFILNRQFTLTSFDSGYFEIPSYTFKFRHENDTIDFESNTLRHYIQVFTPVVDTSQAFKTIKGPIAEPYTFREALPWIALGLFIIVIIFLIIWFIQKRKKNKPLFTAKPKPELPPHVIAFQMFEELRLAKVSHEMTTDEILEALKEKHINTEVSDKLKSALRLADLVKFAKAKPTPLENDVCLNHCVDFVKETKQETVLRVDEKEAGKTNLEAEV
jgi:hypothetical protein